MGEPGIGLRELQDSRGGILCGLHRLANSERMRRVPGPGDEQISMGFALAIGWLVVHGLLRNPVPRPTVPFVDDISSPSSAFDCRPTRAISGRHEEGSA
jgi:hypothetical protein